LGHGDLSFWHERGLCANFAAMVPLYMVCSHLQVVFSRGPDIRDE
jgi:hypothetical protein